MIRAKQHQGFTIVELLIVVVVIAILAAITIVAYNGIQNRAKQSANASAVSQLGKKLATYFHTNSSQYPADTTQLQSQLGMTLGTSDRYIVDNSLSPAQYCLSMTNGTLADSYAVSSTMGSAVKGVCVTNLVTHPSYEAGLPSGTHYNATSSVTTGTGVTSGNNALRLHSTRTGNGEAMRFIQGGFANLTTISIGTTYTFSADVTVLGSFAASEFSQRVIRYRWEAGSSSGSAMSDQAPNVAATQRLFATGASPSGTTGHMLQFNHFGTSSDPDVVIDGVMVTEGPTRFKFGDGSSPGWWWKGDPNISTSVGPAQLY